MSLMPGLEWVGATEAGRIAGVGRKAAMAAIKAGQLGAEIQQREERKRILILRSEAERWARERRMEPITARAPTRNMPRDYPRLRQAEFVAAMSVLFQGGRVRSEAWIEPAALVFCFRVKVMDAARPVGLGSGISRSLNQVADASAGLTPEQIAAARRILGAAELSAADLARLVIDAALQRRRAKDREKHQRSAARQNMSALEKLNERMSENGQ